MCKDCVELLTMMKKQPGKNQYHGATPLSALKIKTTKALPLTEKLQNNSRYILQLPMVKKILAGDIDRIIPAGIKEVLLPYGNHSRGCMFSAISHLINPKLEASFNKIGTEIKGFHYRRLDIK
jgi:hypothetical protein